MVAVSPRRATSVGPGSRLLYAHTLDSFPPPRSTMAGFSVRVNPVGEKAGGMYRGLRVAGGVLAASTSGTPTATAPAEAAAPHRKARRLRCLDSCGTVMALSSREFSGAFALLSRSFSRRRLAAAGNRRNRDASGGGRRARDLTRRTEKGRVSEAGPTVGSCASKSGARWPQWGGGAPKRESIAQPDRGPLTQAIGSGPLYLPRDEIELRSIRRLGIDLVEVAPRAKSCAVDLRRRLEKKWNAAARSRNQVMNSRTRMLVELVASALLLADLAWAQSQDKPGTQGFPAPDRPVAGIISPEYSDEKTRDAHGEAERVMNLLGIKPGQRVADIGAGLGYYTVRVARRLGPGARVGIIDMDRPTQRHGTPPALLHCELTALGYRQLSFMLLAPADGYLAVFAPPETLPLPSAIKPCRQ